jgi:hypothetical protein
MSQKADRFFCFKGRITGTAHFLLSRIPGMSVKYPGVPGDIGSAVFHPEEKQFVCLRTRAEEYSP